MISHSETGHVRSGFEDAELGGSAINIVEALIQNGVPARLISPVGAVDFVQVRAKLKNSGISTSGLVPYDGPTNVLIGFIGSHATRSIFLRGGQLAEKAKLSPFLPARSVIVFAGSRDPELRLALRQILKEEDHKFVFAPSYPSLTFPKKSSQILRDTLT